MTFTRTSPVLQLIILIGALTVGAFSQTKSSVAQVISVYSENGKYFLKTIPFDNISPSIRGTTSVYQVGNDKPLYTFERGFDPSFFGNDSLLLSNDGRTIFYATSWDAHEDNMFLKSVTIYKNGEIVRSFTKPEVTGCNEKKERCELTYFNYADVVDKDKSKWGTSGYTKVFKNGVSEQEKFLSDYPVFVADDIVYLTDSKKNTHLFDLKGAELVRSVPFTEIYEQLRNVAHSSKTEIVRFDVPIYLDFPKLRNGETVSVALGKLIGMKPADATSRAADKYKLYSLVVSGYLYKDGTFDVEKFRMDEGLPTDKVLQFFKTSKLDGSSVPSVADKWYIDDEYFYFRKPDNAVARQEKRQELIKQREQISKNLAAEKIGDVYIPKNLEECFIELDRNLTEIDKKEMMDLPNRDEMIKYHRGLGMWIRNNWGLWGGSRLQAYFTSRGIRHPEDMSSVVLFYYYDWLKGNKESWKEWEKNPKQPYS